MFCISISHRNTRAKEREQFALTAREQEMLWDYTVQNADLGGCVILMTCNRSEVYFTGREAGYRVLERFYADQKGVSPALYREHVMRYEGTEAVRHLFRVVCGLDSAVLGEVEIIRQVKQAYQQAVEQGRTDAELNLVFQGALRLAKEMASRSLMTRLPVSVGTLATEAALEFCQMYQEPHILLVGAGGTIGSIVMRDLQDACSRARIVGTSRRHGAEQAEFRDTEQTSWVHYDRRYEYLSWADVVISATGSPHYTFLADRVQAELPAGRRLLFIDLAVPRDIDEDIGMLDGCLVRNMDYIQSLAQGNNERKQAEAKKAERIAAKRVDDLEKDLLLRSFMEDCPDSVSRLRNKSASWLLFRLRDQLDSHAFRQVLEGLKEDS